MQASQRPGNLIRFVSPVLLPYFFPLHSFLFNLIIISSCSKVETEANLTLHDPGYWEVPEVSEGNIHETVFIWMRFLHAAIVPSVIFILNKEIRQKGTALLCCSRSNRLNSTAPR